MKTEQEQIKAIKQIIDERVETTLGQVQGRHGNVIKTVDTVIIARDSVEAGYGDVSEYKAEREMLGSQIKVLKQRLNNKYIEIEQLKAENARLLKFCEKQFTFDTTENNKYSIFSSVRKNFANKIEEKLNDIFGTAVDNLDSMQDITDIIDELLEEYEIYDN